MTVNSSSTLKPSTWQIVLFITLGFWLSSSITLDGLVMPTMYTSGMMAEPGFATAGYSLFWVFNRVEVLCAAAILTSVLVLRYSRHPWHRPGQFTLIASVALLLITLIDTYGLTPTMSGIGIQLDLFTVADTTPQSMNQLHISYWILETLKLSISASLLWFYSRPSTPVGRMSSVS
jgi:Domain of unknown function (DUF4149)